MEAVIADLSKLREQIRNMKTMQHLVVDLAHTKSELGEPLSAPKFRGLTESYLADSQLIKSADYLTSLDHEEALISAAFERATASKQRIESAAGFYRKLTGLGVKIEQREVDKELDVVTTNYSLSVQPGSQKAVLQGNGELSDLGHHVICGKLSYNLDTPDGLRDWRERLHTASAVRHKI